MLGRPQRVDSPRDDESDEFDAGSDDEVEGGIKAQVSRYKSKYVGGSDKRTGKRKIPVGNGNNILEELLNLPEDQLQDYLDDPDAKQDVIQMLLKKEEPKQNKNVRRTKDTAQIEKASRQYPGKEDPTNPENEADFKKAYQKLAERLATEKAEAQMLLNPKELQAVEQERSKVKSSQQFRERVYGYADKVRQKKDMLKEDMLNTQLRECTFSPRVINPTERPRALNTFLEDQQRFLQRKQAAAPAAPQEEVYEIPKINENSAAMASQKPRDEPIYERLYAISKKPIQIEEKKEEKPQVQLNGERREFRLYQIAVEKNKEWFEKKAQEANPKKPPRAKKDPNVDPMLIQGFRKEFLNAVVNTGLAEGTMATYEQMKTILASMWFIRANLDESAENETVSLVKKLWSTLKASEQNLVPINTLEAYVAAILNIKLVKPEEEEQKAASQEKREEPLTLSNEEIQKIFQDYELLYLNRKSNKPQKRKQDEPKEFQFKPSLCKESVKLAENYREKYVPKQEDSKMGKPETSAIRNDLAVLADAMANKKRAQEE